MRLSFNTELQQTLTMHCIECGEPLPETNHTHATESDITKVEALVFNNPPETKWKVCKKCGQCKLTRKEE
jgi:hypothetical protein